MFSSPIRADESASTEKTLVVERLSRQFRRPLLRFFEKRIGRRAEVEDLVQEVFLRLVGGGNVESVQHPEAYLFRTAANLLYDRQRQRVSRATEAHEPYDDTMHGDSREVATPECEALGSESIEQLVAALHELPERTCAIWVLYHLEDLSHAQISQRLGISVSTIEKHMGRATAHLLKKLRSPT